MALVFPAVVTCPALTNPDNGTVSVPSNNFGSIATYTCNQGYNLTGGGMTRTCGANGMWSGGDPTCQSTLYLNFLWRIVKGEIVGVSGE